MTYRPPFGIPAPASRVKLVSFVILRSFAVCGLIFVKLSKIAGYATGLVYEMMLATTADLAGENVKLLTSSMAA